MMPGRPDQFTQDVDRRMALAREWDELVEQVRALEGFEDFLRPPRLETLLPAADRGPVVIINISRWRCDALVVRASGVSVVELPNLRQEDVVAEVEAYLDAVQGRQAATLAGRYTRGTSVRDIDPADAANPVEAALDRCLHWMWDAFAADVLRHLGYTAPPAGDWPRIWWCPTGPLALLPVHAAGDHSTAGEAVLDRVISSYTPTLRALVEARNGAGPRHPGAERMLFVGMPHTPGQADLPNVQSEQLLITELFGDACTALVGERATRDTVMAQLHDHEWVHFACHGEQNLADPSHGGLLVHDGPLTVTDFSAQQYSGDFAYLSGCKTAVGGVHLPDEAITLAAALHYTGYRHVIATLWSIWDKEAAQVAKEVYEDVAAGGVLNADRSAQALHHAVRRLRTEHRHRPSVWTPFAHTGP
ncbi:CHAT domain-containing protein [Dactylosporangium sp. NPDC051541]|uniref:CHAT domain-containing protein n=1 Tax=Dactylosporangium sp. NPDC051541 TaxID=3363977 RepID=UPI0037945903